MANFFYGKDDQEFGPVSSRDLKQLAADGRLLPTDLVWQEGVTKKVKAAQCRGLVFNRSSVPPAMPPPLPPNSTPESSGSSRPLANQPGIANGIIDSIDGGMTPSGQSSANLFGALDEANIDHSNPSRKPSVTGIAYNKSVIIGSCVLCFPVGFILLWKHPTWSIVRKSGWTAVGICGVLILGVAFQIQTQSTQAALKEANSLWDGGKQADAVNRYRQILNESASFLSESERPVVFRRVIDYDADHDNLPSARRLIEKATNSGITLTLDSARGQELLAKFAAIAAEKKRSSEESSRTAPKQSVSNKRAFNEAYEQELEFRNGGATDGWSTMHPAVQKRLRTAWTESLAKCQKDITVLENLWKSVKDPARLKALGQTKPEPIPQHQLDLHEQLSGRSAALRHLLDTYR